MCNSRDVAALFGKRHDNVLQSLDRLECSPSFTERNFALSDYRDASGRAVRSMNMTKDGFVFLVMGFTGVEFEEKQAPETLEKLAVAAG